MAFLVLDLDEASIVSDGRESFIHSSQEIWGRFKAPLGLNEIEIGILNPEKLTALIEKAYESDGVIILTSGLWGADIRKILAEELQENFGLSAKVAKQLTNCLFYSPETEIDLHSELEITLTYEEKINQLQHMLKGQRLTKIIQAHNLEGKSFVAFDDNLSHIRSFLALTNVTAVHVTTFNDSLACYAEALTALNTAYYSLPQKMCVKRLLNTEEAPVASKRQKVSHPFFCQLQVTQVGEKELSEVWKDSQNWAF